MESEAVIQILRLNENQNITVKRILCTSSFQIDTDILAVMTILKTPVPIVVNNKKLLLPSNTALLLNSHDIVEISDPHETDVNMLLFNPAYVNSLITPDYLQNKNHNDMPEATKADLQLLNGFTYNITHRICYSSEIIFMQINTLLHATELYLTNSTENTFQIRHNLLQLLSLLLKIRPENHPALVTIPEFTGALQCSLEFIHRNIFTNMTLQSITHASYTNRTTLNNLFKKVFGTSIKKYIVNLRMCIASKYLVTTDYTVNKIAEMAGIDNVSQFSKIFKKTLLLSPGEYRKIFKLRIV